MGMLRNFLVGLLVCNVTAVYAQNPYDILSRSYAPYMDLTDPLAFPVKVRSLTRDRYTFWRGSKDVFFVWTKDHAGQWFTQMEDYVPSHADLHVGNIGSYAAAGEFGTLAFGMVDFDDAIELPFQVELLQGFITLELMAAPQQIEWSAENRQRVFDAAIDAYRNAIASDATASDLLADHPLVRTAMRHSDKAYADELAKYVGNDGLFFKGSLKNDILRPANELADAIADGLAQAVIDSRSIGGLFRYRTRDEIRSAIKDVTLRTRLGSSGSQGLRKYFVLMDSPFAEVDGDIILYLKEEIPSAAERSGAVPVNSRSAGRRVAETMAALTRPAPFINGWCAIDGSSYWVHFKEPWSDELDAKDAKTLDELVQMAHVWGTVAGATRTHQAKHDRLASLLTPQLVAQLSDLSARYVQRNDDAFVQFCNDPRVDRLVRYAEKALMSVE